MGLIALLLGMVILLVTLERGLRPMIQTTVKSRATGAVTQIVNTAVTGELTKLDLDYEDLVQLDRDDEGTITAVQTRMAAVNRFKANLSAAVQTAVDQYQIQKINIPIGTLTGSDILSGRGPSVPLTIDMAGSMSSAITSVFDSAGINQTRHQLMLTVTVDVKAIVPWYEISTTVSADFLIAETILVGTVPGAYTHVISGSSDGLADDIMLYGQEGQTKSD